MPYASVLLSYASVLLPYASVLLSYASVLSSRILMWVSQAVLRQKDFEFWTIQFFSNCSLTDACHNPFICFTYHKGYLTWWWWNIKVCEIRLSVLGFSSIWQTRLAWGQEEVCVWKVMFEIFRKICVCVCVSVCLPVRLSICLSACLPVCLSVCLSVCMYVYTYLCVYACMYVRTYVCMYVCMYVCT